MKKLMILAAFAFLGMQHTQAQIVYSPEAGINLSKIVGSKGGNSDVYKLGYKFGFNVEFSIAQNTSLAPGLFYTTKGSMHKSEIAGIKSKASSNLGYMEVPINILYRLPVSSGNILVNVGPYVSYAINGSSTTEIDGLPKTTSKINFGSKNSETNPLDYGFNVGAGYEAAQGIYVRAQYGMGLANMSNASNVSRKNQNIQISLGYTIGNHNR